MRSLSVSGLRACAAAGSSLFVAACLASPALAAGTVTAGHASSACPSPDFPTIQQGVDAAGAGGTVKVCPGSYTENVKVKATGETVTSVSGAAQTTLTGAGANSTAATLRLGGAGDVVKNLTLKGDPGSGKDVVVHNTAGAASPGRVTANTIVPTQATFAPTGVLVNGGHALVAHNTIRSGGSSFALGVMTTAGSAAVNNNTVKVDGNGIVFQGAAGTAKSNTVSAGDTAIFVNSARSVQVGDSSGHGNSVTNSEFGILVYQQTGKVTVAGNSVFDADRGIYALSSNGVTFLDNTVTRDTSATEDCLDDSHGTGTAGTANTWQGNVGAKSKPAGLCTAPSGT